MNIPVVISLPVRSEETAEMQIEKIGTTSRHVNRIIKKKDGVVNKTFVQMLEALGYDIKLTYVKRNGMSKEKPIVKTQNAHFLKGHASWLYCDNCNKTVAYLCYVTYRYFRFSFICSCGGHGWVENSFGAIDLESLSANTPARSPANKRYCCASDGSSLFSPVPKNLQSYKARIVCAQCNTKYEVSEDFGI